MSSPAVRRVAAIAAQFAPAQQLLQNPTAHFDKIPEGETATESNG
jgi:hypothetical protein